MLTNWLRRKIKLTTKYRHINYELMSNNFYIRYKHTTIPVTSPPQKDDEPTSNRIRSYLRKSSFDTPRPNNELTKHYPLTDFERTAKQLSSASTYPWTSCELSSIVERTKFTLSSDHIQTKFDLTWTRLLTRNYLRTVIEKTSNLVL